MVALGEGDGKSEDDDAKDELEFVSQYSSGRLERLVVSMLYLPESPAQPLEESLSSMYSDSVFIDSHSIDVPKRESSQSEDQQFIYSPRLKI